MYPAIALIVQSSTTSRILFPIDSETKKVQSPKIFHSPYQCIPFIHGSGLGRQVYSSCSCGRSAVWLIEKGGSYTSRVSTECNEQGLASSLPRGGPEDYSSISVVEYLIKGTIRSSYVEAA